MPSIWPRVPDSSSCSFWFRGSTVPSIWPRVPDPSYCFFWFRGGTVPSIWPRVPDPSYYLTTWFRGGTVPGIWPRVPDPLGTVRGLLPCPLPTVLTRPVACGGPGGRAPRVLPGPPVFLYQIAFVHAWPPHGSGGPLLQNCHATGLVLTGVSW